ncbi:MAG: cupin domain-containing protein [Candidatus Omnitrophica bacterium]|nr:cupin domain-containing protein [Candidatus Omnitrophota bacterium]
MANNPTQSGFIVKHRDDVQPVACPCGSSTRIITSQDTPTAGFHITHIQNSKKHFHKKTTEIYYILEGSGILEIGAETINLKPGTTILIHPNTPHRGCGDFKTIVVPIPAFDPEDEFQVDESD